MKSGILITVVLVGALLAPLAMADSYGTTPTDGTKSTDGTLSTNGTMSTNGTSDPMAMGMGEGADSIAEMVLGRMGEQLNLTQEQKTSIRQIAEESRSDMQQGREAVRTAWQDLCEAADKGDDSAIDDAGKAAGEALAKQAKQRAEVSKKVEAVLTEEQRTKFKEMKETMKQQMGERREQRMMRRQTP